MGEHGDIPFITKQKRGWRLHSDNMRQRGRLRGWEAEAEGEAEGQGGRGGGLRQGGRGAGWGASWGRVGRGEAEGEAEAEGEVWWEGGRGGGLKGGREAAGGSLKKKKKKREKKRKPSGRANDPSGIPTSLDGSAAAELSRVEERSLTDQNGFSYSSSAYYLTTRHVLHLHALN